MKNIHQVKKINTRFGRNVLTMADMSRNYVKIGKLGRPHGVYGAIRFRPIFSESVSLSNIIHVFLGPTKKKLKVRSFKKGVTPRLVFESVSSPEEAKSLVNEDLFVLRSDLPSLAEDEFYLSDLVGSSVYDNTNTLIGEIESFYSNGAQDIMRLTTDIEIPLVKDVFIKNILNEDKKVYLCISKEDLLV